VCSLSAGCSGKMREESSWYPQLDSPMPTVAVLLWDRYSTSFKLFWNIHHSNFKFVSHDFFSCIGMLPLCRWEDRACGLWRHWQLARRVELLQFVYGLKALVNTMKQFNVILKFKIHYVEVRREREDTAASDIFYTEFINIGKQIKFHTVTSFDFWWLYSILI